MSSSRLRCVALIWLFSDTRLTPSRIAQGFFSGAYNAIAGKIKSPKGEVGDISGFWSDAMELHRKGVCFGITLLHSSAKLTRSFLGQG